MIELPSSYDVKHVRAAAAAGGIVSVALEASVSGGLGSAGERGV